MKKFAISIITSILLFSAIPALALENGTWGLNEAANKGGYTDPNGATTDTVEVLVGRIVTVFLSALAIFFFALMLYGGIRWMTARGNEEYVLKGKNIIEAAIIGIVVVLAARSLAQFILEQLNK